MANDGPHVLIKNALALKNPCLSSRRARARIRGGETPRAKKSTFVHLALLHGVARSEFPASHEIRDVRTWEADNQQKRQKHNTR